MTVRKRTWTNRDGSQGEAWVVAYTDQAGKRRLKSFDKKREADSYQVGLGSELRSGVHVPDSQSVTIAEAGRLWLSSCEAAGLERATLGPYRQHLDLHIVPLIGAVKLSKLTAPMVRAFEDKLRLDRSPAMTRKVRGSLSAILADARSAAWSARTWCGAYALVAGAALKRTPTSGRRASSRLGSTSRRPTRLRLSWPLRSAAGGRCS